MFPTTEARWFFPGPIPPAVEEWFDQGEAGPPAAFSRTDTYLRLPGDESLGIKLRQGRIEVKQRQGQLGEQQFHPKVTAVVESWRKWSFPLAEVDQSWRQWLQPAGHWLPVAKSRRLRRYRVTAGWAFQPCPISEFPGLGCDWELTAVTVGDDVWWTAAFEAFGEAGRQQEALSRLAPWLLSQGDPPHLPAAASFAYPRWLQMTAGRPSPP